LLFQEEVDREVFYVLILRCFCDKMFS